MMIGDGN